MTINFQQIRLDHDLRGVIERYLGQPNRGGKWLCPFHKENTGSFSITPDGQHFKCFGCHVAGDVTDFVAMMDSVNVTEAAKKLGGYLLDLGMSKDQIRQKQAEIRQEYQRRQEQRKAEDKAKREEAIKRVSSLAERVGWYHSMVDRAREYWHGQGLPDVTIERYQLGFCPECPTYPKSPSYVIPYHASGQLVSIRHRLANPNGCGKYRPEFSGLPNQLFNADQLKMEREETDFSLLDPGQILIVEGEVKSIFLSDVAGIPAVGVPGAAAWQDDWLPMFADMSMVYVVFDDGAAAEEQARKVTRTLNGSGIKAVHVVMSCKPDDFFVKFGGTSDEFLRILRQGRRVL